MPKLGQTTQQDVSDKQAVSLYAERTNAGDGAVKFETTTRRNLRVAIFANDTAMGSSSGTGDDLGMSSVGLRVIPFLRFFNGSNWDRARNNVEQTLLSSAARTATLNSSDFTNYNAKGIIVTLDVIASADTPSIVLKIQIKDALSGKYETILEAAAVTGAGTHSYIVYPGVGAAAEDIVEVVGYPLSRTYRIRVEHADTDSITYSVGGSEIL